MGFRPLLSWYGFLGGPLAWALHIAARYPLVPAACKTGKVWVLHVITAVCLTLTIGAVVAAVRVSRTSQDAATAPRPPESRVRYMAWTGLGFSALFGAAILLELLPALLQDPCLGVRTSSWRGQEAW